MRPGAIQTTRLTTLWLVTVAMLSVTVLVSGALGAAASTCIQNGDGTYLKDVCIVAPENGAVVSGMVTVSSTVDPARRTR